VAANRASTGSTTGGAAVGTGDHRRLRRGSRLELCDAGAAGSANQLTAGRPPPPPPPRGPAPPPPPPSNSAAPRQSTSRAIATCRRTTGRPPALPAARGAGARSCRNLARGIRHALINTLYRKPGHGFVSRLGTLTSGAQHAAPLHVLWCCCSTFGRRESNHLDAPPRAPGPSRGRCRRTSGLGAALMNNSLAGRWS